MIKAHFDGKHVVPDEPVPWPKGCPLEIRVRKAKRTKVQRANKRPSNGRIKPFGVGDPILNFGRNPVRCRLSDASKNHDRYIYTGT